MSTEAVLTDGTIPEYGSRTHGWRVLGDEGLGNRREVALLLHRLRAAATRRAQYVGLHNEERD